MFRWDASFLGKCELPKWNLEGLEPEEANNI